MILKRFLPINGSFEFRNNANTSSEYAYDTNGNLTKDLNKNIADIQYNFLNLPSQITFSDGNTITYLYGANGTKLRTAHKIGSVTITTYYCDNVIYESGIAKLLSTEVGYISLSDKKYHYYLQDHQGNNRMVVDQNGSVEETNNYYPFGGVFANTGNVQPYKYNGKEFDSKKGLNWYDYGARHYDAALGRFMTVDPMAEKYYPTSLYEYCLNNPVKFIDIDGKDPGDVFKTTNQAAIDWGMYYNGASILRKREFGSTIYEVRNNGKRIGYAYSEAKEGTAHKVRTSLPPNKEKVAADIHSHGNYDIDYDDNLFSEVDKKGNNKKGINGYLASPNGLLQEYDTSTEKVSIISRNLPSDPKDPNRQNKKNPVDIPAERKRSQTKVEQQKIYKLKRTEMQEPEFKTTF